MSNELKSIQDRFQAATNEFVEKIKSDPNVIAIIVCGSLAYDQVWEHSDIDTFIIVRDQPINNDSYCIVEDDILINVSIIPRSKFKRNLERFTGGSVAHSILAKGKIVYTTDDSLYEYFEEMKQIGSNDVSTFIFYTACELISIQEKANKWLLIKNDPLYAQLYILRAVQCIAQIEVIASGILPTREVIQQALALNPELIIPYYQDAMSHPLSREELSRLIDGIDTFLLKYIDDIKQPVLEFMCDQEIKTVSMLCKHFRSDGHFLIHIFDYLADQGVIAKVSQPIRITPKGKKSVEEIAYMYFPD